MNTKRSIFVISILFLIAIGLKFSVYQGVFNLSDDQALHNAQLKLKQEIDNPSLQKIKRYILDNKTDVDISQLLIDLDHNEPYTAYLVENKKLKYWSKEDFIPTRIKSLFKSPYGYFQNHGSLYHYYWTDLNTSIKILIVEVLIDIDKPDDSSFNFSNQSNLNIKTIDGLIMNIAPKNRINLFAFLAPNIFFLIGLTWLLSFIPQFISKAKKDSIHPYKFGFTYLFLILLSTVFFLAPIPSAIFWAISLTILFSSLSFAMYRYSFNLNLKSISTNTQCYILYQSILAILLLTFTLSYQLVQSQVLKIDYTKHFLFHQQLIGLLAILIILCLSASLVCNKIMILIRSLNNSFESRIIPICFSLAFISIFYILFFTTSNYILFISLAGISLMLLDLFQDRPSLNFTWLFTWVVIISAFLSISLTVHHLDSSIQSTSENIQDKLSIIDQSIFEAPIHSAIDQNQNLQELLSPPHPFNVQPALVKQELSLIMPNLKNSIWDMETYSFDNRGICITQNESPFTPSFIEQAIHSPAETISTITPDGTLQYIITQKKEPKGHPYNPIVSFLTFKPLNQPHLDLLQNIIVQELNGTQIYKSPRINEITSSNGANSTLPDRQNDYLFSRIIKTNSSEVYLLNKKLKLIKPLSLFSLLITLTFLILLLSTIVNTYIKILPTQLKLFISKRKSLRYKIQLTVLSSIIGSFMIIAFITLIYLRNSYQHTHLQKVETLIESFLHKYDLNDVLSKIKDGNPNIMSDIDNFSSIHNCDIQFYNNDGTSYPYRKNQNTHKINPRAYKELHQQDRNLAILTNNANSFLDDYGKIAFLRIEQSGVIQGILKIDSANPERSLSQGLSNFLSTLLNVYVFLFLIAGTIAIALANSITKPISVLGDNLKNLKLGKRQEPLKWENQDELGDLINDYNLTVEKLEESAKLLAITERESAWREMAKQVAHEIKNPLTPMKLSIQHLKMASGKAENPQIKKMIERVSLTLLEQIDALSDIASEFSNFAHFPKPENQTTVLNEVIETAHDLFRKRDDMQINLYVPIDEIYVFADKNYLLRVFNNLLKNAIQAIPTDRSGKIEIRLFKKNGYALVEIEDNGTGIPEDMHDKVFTPNFTTKNSGTGLGLAISNNIIESFNGRIYFHTQVDKGTIFNVEIPLMRKEDNFKTSEHVTLD